MYHIVEFVNSNEVEVVHSNWLEGGESFWPPFVSLAKLRRATKDGVMPGADWNRFRVRVMYSHDVYEIACAKLLEATITSDLNTEDEDNRPEYMKRKNRGCKRIVSSSEEEEEEQGRTAALRAPTKKKTYTQLAPAPCIPSLGALGECSQPAAQGFWSPGHISETPSDANNSSASPWASHLSANITAPSPPQWSPVSTTNSLSATPTDTPTHAAASRSQSSDQTGFQTTPPIHGTQNQSCEEAVPTGRNSVGPQASPLSANITALSPPPWSPVSTTNSLSATPTDTTTHAAAGRSQTSGQTGFQHIPPLHGIHNRSCEGAMPTGRISVGPWASPLSANITVPSPPPWSPVSSINSLRATPTDTPTHAAAGRSQTSIQTGFQNTPQVYDTQHRSSREGVPTAIAKEILIQLDSIREQQLLILVQLQKISSSQTVPDFTPDPTHFGLPLSTIEELQCLEETLKNPEEKKNLTVFLGMVGGMTLKDTVGRVLKRTMNSSLARLINWSGANRKPAFKGLTLKSVVLDAVRRNALTKDNTEKEIELLITRWLQLASDRDGGRSQRANRQTTN
nr:uncharacterized protein LOC129453312 [Misgurnus anguillicaudatus]